MKVGTFHSSKRDARPVYHDNDQCTEGNNIEPQYRRPGTDSRRKCDHCERLEREGK